MNIFVSILSRQILPIFLIASTGYLIARQFRIDARMLSQVGMNSFMPCLVFETLIKTRVDLSQSARTALYGVAAIAISALLGFLVARLLRISRTKTISLMLVVMFTNVGSFGLPVIALAFGQEALAHGTVYYLVNNILLYTIGIALLTSGAFNWHSTLGQVARMPILWAVALAGLLALLRIELPEIILAPIHLMSSGAVPLMLILLGMQFCHGRIQTGRLTWVAVGLRLLVVPLVVSPLLGLLGLSSAAVQASVLQSATPSGVATSILALDYNIEPGFISSVVFLSSALSALTLPPIVLLLGT